jgi:hypothetical protein
LGRFSAFIKGTKGLATRLNDVNHQDTSEGVMKTQTYKTIKILSLAAAVSSASFLSVDIRANEKPGTGFDEPLIPRTQAVSSDLKEEPLAELIYNDPSRGPAIHSYPGSAPEKKAYSPELTYVSLAYGPAIYSYPHVGSEKTVPLNIEYVDKAYGPAIYSYDRAQVSGTVKVFSILFE